MLTQDEVDDKVLQLLKLLQKAEIKHPRVMAEVTIQQLIEELYAELK